MIQIGIHNQLKPHRIFFANLSCIRLRGDYALFNDLKIPDGHSSSIKKPHHFFVN
jgi:hypothetical protein